MISVRDILPRFPWTLTSTSSQNHFCYLLHDSWDRASILPKGPWTTTLPFLQWTLTSRRNCSPSDSLPRQTCAFPVVISSYFKRDENRTGWGYKSHFCAKHWSKGDRFCSGSFRDICGMTRGFCRALQAHWALVPSTLWWVMEDLSCLKPRSPVDMKQ